MSQDAISRFETASEYQASVRERCYRITEICDDAPKLRPDIDPSILKFWKQGLEQQKGRACEYNAAAEKLTLLETEEQNGKSRSQEWKDQVDVGVGQMEVWATKMREILSQEDLRKLVAEEEQGDAAKAAKSV